MQCDGKASFLVCSLGTCCTQQASLKAKCIVFAGLSATRDMKDLDLTVRCKNSCQHNHQGLPCLLDWWLVCSQVCFVFLKNLPCGVETKDVWHGPGCHSSLRMETNLDSFWKNKPFRNSPCLSFSLKGTCRVFGDARGFQWRDEGCCHPVWCWMSPSLPTP